MKTLVVGGNGFIGSHLVDELVARGWMVTVLDLHGRRYDPVPGPVEFIRGDLSKSFLVREALIDVDVVFHLAWTTIHEVANEDPAADIRSNLIPSIQLLQACRQESVGRVVFASSGGTVYGPAQELPIPETHLQAPINAYGISKLALEKYLHMFSHLYGLDYAVVRPSVPYGPRQNPLKRQGAVAVFLYRVSHGLPITIWGDGSTTRDYFYISDLVDALIAAGERELNEDPVFNIGGGEEISIAHLLERVQETVGKEAVVEYEPARDFDAKRVVLDISRAKQVLNWQPKVPLDEGLAQTYSWMNTVLTGD